MIAPSQLSMMLFSEDEEGLPVRDRYSNGSAVDHGDRRVGFSINNQPHAAIDGAGRLACRTDRQIK